MYIDSIKVSGWEDVKDSALVTIHKDWTGKEITSDWKYNLIKSEHSPLRELKIVVKFKEVERWIADQLVRHSIGVIPYMATSRPDRGNIPREEQTMTHLTDLKLSLNGQSLLNISKERLCVGKVSKETRELWEVFLSELEKTEPELVFYCVPSCIYRYGCKEFKACPIFSSFVDSLETIPYIKEYEKYNYIGIRYNHYHKHFKKWKKEA